MNCFKLKLNSLKTFVLLLIGFGILTSCTNDFEEINTNPNAPIEVQPALLLRKVIYDYGEQMSYEGFVAGNLLGQYFTAVDFNLFDRHSLTEPQYGGNPWPVLYRNLRDNEIILKSIDSNDGFEVYKGPALIMKAYMTASLTDIFGDVPYSEALSGKEGNVTPMYDSQEEIYTGINGILANLDAGISAINSYSGGIQLEGDILFNGDLSSWIRFANSLKIKYLMRISSEQNVSNQLQAIYDSGNYISSNSQNAVFDFSDSQPNNFRMANLRAGDFNLYIMSLTAQEIFEQLNDPRVSVFYRPTANKPSIYSGVLNGIDASNTSISVADYSLTGRIFREETGKLDANFMTAWETNLFLAEAAQRGFINASPKSLYDVGVQQAFEYWHTELPQDYLTTGNASFGMNGSNQLEQIITQKWIAQSVNGYEGWIEFRRTGFPAFKTVAASLNNNLIPSRMPYPTDEAALNKANFDVASASTNGNSVNSTVWWDN